MFTLSGRHAHDFTFIKVEQTLPLYRPANTPVEVPQSADVRASLPIVLSLVYFVKENVSHIGPITVLLLK